MGVMSLVIPDTPSSRISSTRSSGRSSRTQNLAFQIEDLLDYTFNVNNPEQLQGVRCEGCNDQKVDCNKLLQISVLPQRYMVLHVNRTKFSPKTYKSYKCRNKVSFPLQGLDLEAWTAIASESESVVNSQEEISSIYDLYAIVVHHGRGFDVGHFTCYAKSPQTQIWYLYNDDRVHAVSEEEVAAAEAYLLFYQRRLI